MPRASAADAAATAARIRTVAAQRFAVDGYAATSVDDVATDAGVTRGAVYHHYDSKPGLFAAVVARLQQEVADAVVQAAGDGAGDDGLRRGSHAFLDAITADGRARVLLRDAPAVLTWETWRETDAQTSAVHLREALTGAGVAADMLGATTALLSGAMNEAALWLSERAGDAAARTAAHRGLDRLLDAVVD
ncbi:TetR family transcriptional regulator [Microbacterium sp.]|uniref:TetR/AcrR family transcriptional regulator n=1 Tax=Microbacterium sp. TaxID=51671 RepID=UPI002811BFAF|nr:TetR family transcriptional regulator [Microbacterium sp.]